MVVCVFLNSSVAGLLHALPCANNYQLRFRVSTARQLELRDYEILW